MPAEQEGFFLAMALKPLFAIVLFAFVAVLARLILRAIPDGKLKQLLSRRVGP